MMLEYALRGTWRYWTWLLALAGVIAAGVSAWLIQLNSGLGVTGLGRDVSWGLYIAQFTFLVGVAASAVTVVLPYYLHDVRAFGPVVILGEFIAIASVIASMLFVVVDMGQPSRVLNVLRYPSPASMMCVSRLPPGSAAKLALKEPSSSELALSVREAKCSSGSEIVIVMSAFAANPLPKTVTVSVA